MTQSLVVNLDESRSSEESSTDMNDRDTELCNDSLTSTVVDKILLFSLREKPSTIVSTLLAIQALLIATLNIIWLPLVLAPSLCIHPDDPARTEILSLSLFTSGISTVIFSTIGLRLPVPMVPNFHYISSMVNILKLPELQCPGAGDLYAMGEDYRAIEWHKRLNVLQGAIIIISLIQFAFGITGISGLFDKILSNPLVLIPTTIVIGVSYVKQLINLSSTSDIFIEESTTSQWGIILLTVGIIIITGLRCQNLEFVLPTYTHEKGFSTTRLKLFKMFPVFFAGFFVLIIYPCIHILINGKNRGEKVLLERSFVNSNGYIIHLPFSYGWPTFQAEAFLLMLPAAVTQIIESILIYRVTNFLYGVNIKKRKYINHGMSVEGISSFIAGVFGMTVTSNPMNIGLMLLTGVGSRWVVQLTGGLLILVSIFTSLMRILVDVSPVFIISTLFIISALISVAGLSMIRTINIDSIRSLTIIGASLYAALVIPSIVPSISSDYKIIQVLYEIFTSNIMICVLFASILDTILSRNDETDLQDEPESKKDKEKLGPSFCEELCSICLF